MYMYSSNKILKYLSVNSGQKQNDEFFKKNL